MGSRREAGFSLLEMTIVTALFAAILLLSAMVLGSTTQGATAGTVHQFTHHQAQSVLDAVAADLRQSAAWEYFQIARSGSAASYPGSGGETVTRLTKFYSSNKRTRGTTNDQSNWQFGPLDASSSSLAFLKNVGIAIEPTQGYVVLDFEPREASTSSFYTSPGGINTSGATVANHQPGRMDDDPDRRFIFYRTRPLRGRIIVERVRGFSGITTDGLDTPTGAVASGLVTMSSAMEVGDLGPATNLPAGVAVGNLTIQGVNTTAASQLDGNVTGAGYVRIHVRAVGVVRRKPDDVVVADLETAVATPCGVPPY